MAIQGKLLANFDSFYDAVDRAEVKLKSMDDGATTVGRSLSRMVDDFSGRKIIQDATLATEAVERIGGATKLTEGEQTKLNAKLTEAIAKYEALGEEAPADMVALAEATKQVETPTEGLSTKMIAFGTAIGQMAANAVLALGKLAVEGVMKLSSAMVDLIMVGDDVASVEGNFQGLTREAGLTADTLMGKLREGTHNTISDFALMTEVNKGLSGGLKLTEGDYAAVAQGAFALAEATGVDATTALGQMNEALLTGKTRAIEAKFGNIDLEAATKAYADTLGVEAKELTENETLLAARQAILERVRERTAALGDQTDGLGERVQQAETMWRNFQNQLGKTLATNPVLMASLDALAESLSTAFGGKDQLVAAINKAFSSFLQWVVDGGLVLVEFGKTGAAVFGAIRVPLDAVTAAFAIVIERFSAGIAKAAELAASIPGVGRAFDTTAAAARNAADVWAGFRQRAEEQVATDINLVKGQSAVHEVLGKVETALLNVKTRQAEAAVSTKAERDALEATNTVKTQYNKLTVEQEGALVRATAAQHQFTKDLADFDKSAKVLPPFTGLLTNLETKLVDTSGAAEKLNIRFKSIAEDVADSVAPELDKLPAKLDNVTASVNRLGAASSSLGMSGNLPAVNPITGEGMAETDPRVQNYLLAGYTLGEAMALASGAPTNIGVAHGTWTPSGWKSGTNRIFAQNAPAATAPNVNVNINGSVLSNKDEIARVVGDALVSQMRSLGMRIPIGA